MSSLSQIPVFVRTGRLMSSLSQIPVSVRTGRLTELIFSVAWKWLTGNALVSDLRCTLVAGPERGVTLQYYESLISSLHTWESRLTVWIAWFGHAWSHPTYSIYDSLGLRPFIRLFLPFGAMSFTPFADSNAGKPFAISVTYEWYILSYLRGLGELGGFIPFLVFGDPR